MKVGDVLEEFKETLGNASEPVVLTLTEKNGFMPQAERFNKRLATADTSKYRLIRRNDIAFNPYLLWAGALAQNTVCDSGVISPLYPTFRVRDGFDPRYVGRLLLTPTIVSGYDKIAYGSVPRRRRTSVDDFLGLILPDAPSIEEQRRIAAILDAADALRAKRRQALAKLDTLTQAIFIDMFGDPAFNPSNFPSQDLLDVSDSRDGVKCGPFGTQLAQHEYTDTGVPLWGIPQVNRKFKIETHEFLTPQKAEELSSYSIEPGDIVMTRKGTIGNCAVYPNGKPVGVMHSDLLRIRCNADTNPRFLSDQLTFSREIGEQIRVMSGGAVMPGINVTKLKNITVLNPPSELQAEYANRCDSVDEALQAAGRTLSEFDDLFASLQQRAFRGDL